LFSRGVADRNIYLAVATGDTWSAWRQIPGGLATDAAPTAVEYSGRFYLFSQRHEDTYLYFTTATSAV